MENLVWKSWIIGAQYNKGGDAKVDTWKIE